MLCKVLVVFAGFLDSGVFGMPSSLTSTYKFPYYTRQDWAARTGNDTRPLTTPVPYVVIHHTYLPAACYSVAKCEAAMRSMQNYHSSLEWGDIGYNFCIGSEGGAYEARGWKIRGIRAGNANSFSVGICLIGDWREELPPPIQMETTKALIAIGIEQGVIHPQYKLIGHRQAKTTECPEQALFDEISTWNHFAADGFVISNKTV